MTTKREPSDWALEQGAKAFEQLTRWGEAQAADVEKEQT